MTRRLAREEGLLVGGSCGMAVVAADRVAAEAGPDAVVVVLLPDGGRGYLSKIFDDGWMADYGFLDVVSSEPKVGAIVGRKQQGEDGIPELVHVHPDETVSSAISILREYGVSQVPVVRAEPPVMAAEVVGSVVERDLLDLLVTGTAMPEDPVEKHMSAPLPLIGAGEPLSALLARARTGRCGRRAPGRPPLRGGHPPGRARLPGQRAGPVSDAFETLAIHAGQEPDPTTGAVVVPIHLDLDLRAGRHRRPAGRLRVLALGQPHPHRARGLPGRARGGHRRARLRLGHGGRGRDPAHRAAGPATTS